MMAEMIKWHKNLNNGNPVTECVTFEYSSRLLKQLDTSWELMIGHFSLLSPPTSIL